MYSKFTLSQKKKERKRKKLYVHFVCGKFFRLCAAVELALAQLIRIPVAPLIGFTSGFKVWETPKRLVSGRIAEASTGPRTQSDEKWATRRMVASPCHKAMYGNKWSFGCIFITSSRLLPLDRRNRASLHEHTTEANWMRQRGSVDFPPFEGSIGIRAMHIISVLFPWRKEYRQFPRGAMKKV